MKKLNPQQISEIKASKKGILELAKEYNVSPNAIKYHKSEEFRIKLRQYNKKRYRKLDRESKQVILDKRRKYQQQYHKNRYKTNKEFREKQIERAKKYQKENYKRRREG